MEKAYQLHQKDFERKLNRLEKAKKEYDSAMADFLSITKLDDFRKDQEK